MKQKKSEKKWMILRNKMANCEGTTEICSQYSKWPKLATFLQPFYGVNSLVANDLDTPESQASYRTYVPYFHV